ncbi:MAG: hypothetical protein HDT13_00625 [Butyrivibrio sp.]|nr:hypothetical protein [Butyrivibrio sp.]
MIKEFLKLDFKTSIFFSNNSPIWFSDLLYIRVGKGKVKSYTVLKLSEIEYIERETKYHLTDEYGNTCAVYRDSIFLYRGQNLIIQRLYDIISQAISIVFLAALVFIGNSPQDVIRFLMR